MMTSSDNKVELNDSTASVVESTYVTLSSNNDDDDDKSLLKTLQVATDNEYRDMIQYCKDGYITAIQTLLDTYDCSNILNRCDINDLLQRSQLLYASDKKYENVMILLLDKGADINIQDNRGWTALTYACYDGETRIVKLLLDRGANINLQDHDGATTLILVCGWIRIEIIKILLKYDVYINIQNKNGWTALMYAVSNKDNIEIIELLIEYGADIYMKNYDGHTAYDITRNKEIQQLLSTYMTKNDYILK